jgi:hypothetical protein
MTLTHRTLLLFVSTAAIGFTSAVTFGQRLFVAGFPVTKKAVKEYRGPACEYEGTFIPPPGSPGSIRSAGPMAWGPDLTGDGARELYVLDGGDWVNAHDGQTGLFFWVHYTGCTDMADLTFDAEGCLFVTDVYRDKVRANCGYGTRISNIEYPTGITMAPNGTNVLVGSRMNGGSVREYDLSDGQWVPVDNFINEWIIGGPTDYLGLAVGPDGNIYVADEFKDTVWKIDYATGQVTPFVSPGSDGVVSPQWLAATEEFLDVTTTDGPFIGANVRRYDLLTGQHLRDCVPWSTNGIDGEMFMVNGLLGRCEWDLSGDGFVNTQDLLGLLAQWGNPYTVVDLLDLLSDWGRICP